MKQPSPRAILLREKRRFLRRFLLLLSLSGLVGWAAWLAPWNRVDARVVVEIEGVSGRFIVRSVQR